jgi:hypothetical protein
MEIKRHRRGGKKPGCGRPSVEASKRRVTLATRVKPETKQYLMGCDISAGMMIDRLVEGKMLD